MENQKKSREQVFEERIEELQKENDQLKNDKAMFEEWWRKADAKNLELINALKSIGTIIDVIHKAAKS